MKNKKIEKNKKQEDRIVGRLKSRKIEKQEDRKVGNVEG